MPVRGVVTGASRTARFAALAAGGVRTVIDLRASESRGFDEPAVARGRARVREPARDARLVE